MYSRKSLEDMQIRQKRLVDSSSKEVLDKYTTSRFLTSDRNSSIDYDSRNSFNDETTLDVNFTIKPKATKGFEMPNPSSMKDLMTDHNFYTNLQQRL